MTTRRTRTIALSVGLLALGAASGSAAAAPRNVVAVIKAQDKIIHRMPADRYLNEHLNTSSKPVAEKLAPELGQLYTASQHAVSLVATASTSNARQRQGKADWIKGSREDDRGLLQYRAALRDLIAVDQAAFKREKAISTKTIGAGLILSAKGDKLLRISIND